MAIKPAINVTILPTQDEMLNQLVKERALGSKSEAVRKVLTEWELFQEQRRQTGRLFVAWASGHITADEAMAELAGREATS